jgi:hypothetical protein
MGFVLKRQGLRESLAREARGSLTLVTTRELLEAVLALPTEERARFRDELDASLPDDEDDEFLAMLDARLAAAEAGAPCAPGDEVLARLRARLAR